jgi:glycosyltransferase involved in cell wall biosynthesis
VPEHARCLGNLSAKVNAVILSFAPRASGINRHLPAVPANRFAMTATAPSIAASPSSTHLVLIPCYNPGVRVVDMVRQVRQQWSPVWVVVDGSTDESTKLLQQLAAEDAGVKVLVQPVNGGKGSAVLRGITEALAQGYTHALTMDADGQHPTELVAHFMARSIAEPRALILGKPVFDASAPALRVNGRKISNSWANLETLGAGVGDSLYGFRVYPMRELQAVMLRSRWMRRFDFDPEVAVRLCWEGLKPVNIEAPVKYFSADEGGVSHFKYLRDNVLLTWMHTRLFLEFLVRLPRLLMRPR